LNNYGKTKETEKPAIKCLSCEESWWEEVKLSRLDANGSIIQGQPLQRATTDGVGTYFAYRCLNCGRLLLPSFTNVSASIRTSEYMKLVDIVKVLNENNKQ
jgi:hypothetical protein